MYLERVVYQRKCLKELYDLGNIINITYYKKLYFPRGIQKVIWYAFLRYVVQLTY